MSDFAEKLEVIELLAKHEEALADLYAAYAIKFPDCEIWGFLYGEERKHAEWVRSILDNVYDGSINFTDYHFSDRALNISIKNLNGLTEKAEKNALKLEEALDRAFLLENSIIEDKYLDYFSSKIEGIQKVLDDLKKDTDEHRNLLKKKRDDFYEEKRKSY
ncbi:MAG TPA: hypothetical protein PLK90_10830 [Clostridiales bacterium]|nr:hypothetical protein [Clostridiales bacterium]